MTELNQFVAVPYDLADRRFVAGQQLKCATPSSAIEHAKHLWKILGHTGAVAIVRTGYPESRTTVLRTFGVVPSHEDLRTIA
ncbi:hypothetical protein [Bradyrhizobium sp. CCBAU 51753]|uniref:hypothetical protein n=1 Tax=Bradyrhizobium sp. CCBAU 51753 TaxID=1325100 RepID=UPI00188BE35B|nr:hypothetical protein [Bradyrhizobium sp. CCBAU 51753]QOZ30178.1 hypothetical protein XH93_36735 [Bradyrhizobium sp. CCBAU 51753]